MKYTLLNFLLFIISLNSIILCNNLNIKNVHDNKRILNKNKFSNSLSDSASFPEDESKTKNNISNTKVEKTKLIQCKLCQDMFDFNFNFEDMLKGKKIDRIKRAFDPLKENEEDLKGYFTKDNMEFILKEISMQYFFKGADSGLDEGLSLKLKECKSKSAVNYYSDSSIKLAKECEHIKLGQCEKILNFEEGICLDFNSHIKNIMKNITNKKNNLTPKLNLRKFSEEKTIPPSYNEDTILNFKKYHFKQRELDENSLGEEKNFKKYSESNSDVRKFNDISLIELTPEYIKKNMDSTPKTHWTPPKPVLLNNFEKNIGDQLKDISSLAT